MIRYDMSYFPTWVSIDSPKSVGRIFITTFNEQALDFTFYAVT